LASIQRWPILSANSRFLGRSSPCTRLPTKCEPSLVGLSRVSRGSRSMAGHSGDQSAIIPPPRHPSVRSQTSSSARRRRCTATPRRATVTAHPHQRPGELRQVPPGVLPTVVAKPAGDHQLSPEPEELLQAQKTQADDVHDRVNIGEHLEVSRRLPPPAEPANSHRILKDRA
jgi:hypothetical protein